MKIHFQIFRKDKLPNALKINLDMQNRPMVGDSINIKDFITEDQKELFQELEFYSSTLIGQVKSVMWRRELESSRISLYDGHQTCVHMDYLIVNIDLI